MALKTNERYRPGAIERIRALRFLTRLLGKFHIKGCFSDKQDYHDFVVANNNGQWPANWTNIPDRYDYGYGLKEAKDAVVGYYARIGLSVKIPN